MINKKFFFTLIVWLNMPQSVLPAWRWRQWRGPQSRIFQQSATGRRPFYTSKTPQPQQTWWFKKPFNFACLSGLLGLGVAGSTYQDRLKEQKERLRKFFSLDYWYKQTPENPTLAEIIADKRLINKKNSAGDTPLHQAIINRDVKTAITLIDMDADLSIKNIWQRTPLAQAINQDETAIAALILFKLNQDGKNALIVEPDIGNNTPLHFALKHKNDYLIKLILQYGGHNNLINNEGKTPTIIAQNLGKKWVDLLQTPKDLLVTKIQTPEHVISAIKTSAPLIDTKPVMQQEAPAPEIITPHEIEQPVPIVSLKRAQTQDPSELIIKAIDDDDADWAISLAHNNPSILSAKGIRASPLRIAIHRNKWSLAKELLSIAQENNIDIAAYKDLNNDTLLHDAVNNNAPKEIITALLETTNIDLKASNNNGFTPLNLAAQRGNLEAVQTLLDHAQKTNNSTVLEIANAQGNTPLNTSILSAERNPAVIAALIEASKGYPDTLNKQNKQGNAPIFNMIGKKLDPSLVNQLINAGASTSMTDAKRRTLKQFAKEKKYALEALDLD